MKSSEPNRFPSNLALISSALVVAEVGHSCSKLPFEKKKKKTDMAARVTAAKGINAEEMRFLSPRPAFGRSWNEHGI